MSSLWTPGGERPVGRPEEASAAPQGTGAAPGPGAAADVDAKMAEAVERLLRTPAEEIVATHARGLFELARIHLSVQPPQLPQARLAIDALNCLVEGLGPRLGEDAAMLAEALGQIRLAWLEIDAATRAGAWEPGGDPS